MTTSKHTIHIQIATQTKPLPTKTQLKAWIMAVLKALNKTEANITLRIVGEKESQQLNTSYRHKTGPTNVLSFPYEDACGDMAICAPLVQKEAKEQHKTEISHWAHLVVHGTLHLCGYDHLIAKEAQIMEKLEIAILAKFGFANPYQQSL